MTSILGPERLTALLQGTGDIPGASLATRMLISRLRIEVRVKPQDLRAKLLELQDFIARNDFACEEIARL